MRIVQITTDNREHGRDYSAPRPYFGTAPTGLFAGFEALDVEVHVISCSMVPMEAPEKLAPNIWFHQPVVGRWSRGRSGFLGCVRTVRRLVGRIRPDLVHGQGSEKECALAAAMSGRPSVVTLHGNMRVHARRPEHRGSRYYRMVSFLEGVAVRRADGVVAISSFTRDRLEPEAKRLTLIPNAVDSRCFDIERRSSGVPRLLFVGAIAPHKNPVALIEACEPFLRDGRCTLALAGSGDPDSEYGKEFGRLVNEVPGVSALGFLDRERLRDEFARSDLLVHPTLEDNCPMVILEAMAAGLPVAASAIGGVPDLVDPGVTGLLFDSLEPEAMRSGIDRLLADVPERERMGVAARRRARERFDPEVVARRHLEFYDSLLAAR